LPTKNFHIGPMNNLQCNTSSNSIICHYKLWNCWYVFALPKF